LEKKEKGLLTKTPPCDSSHCRITTRTRNKGFDWTKSTDQW